jgi:hypothetical protein
MLIYFCLIIPLIAVCVLAWKFHAKMAWWEYILVFGVPVICIVATKATSSFMQTSDTEYWNTQLVKVTYYEDWDEWIHKTCERCHEDCTGSGEDRRCHEDCTSYDCSYREYHPEYWEAEDNTGHKIGISREYFEQLCKLWGSRSFVNLNRNFYRDDGDAYTSTFDNNFEHTIPYTSAHIYENRVKCSRSVFNFAEVDTEDVNAYGLYSYPPANGFWYDPILGGGDPVASRRLQIYNAQLGAWKQVHMMILVYKDQPVKAAIYQEGYWKGGNKNEFILCIGVRDNKIAWAKVISWTEEDMLKVGVEKAVVSMPLDLSAISDYMAKEVKNKFVRKQFKDFSYITVEPTLTAIWIAFAITLLTTVGLSVFVVRNDFDSTGYHRTYRFKIRKRLF